MMEPYHIDPLLNAFILNHRKINSLFRKQTNVSRTNVEILAFANTVISFNAYQVQQYFGEMNIQQVRLSIRKLISTGAVELWFVGVKNRPTVYIINDKGRALLRHYEQLWHLINN